MLKKINLNNSLRYIIPGLPLAGIVFGSLLPMPDFGRQLLILALFVWCQIYFICEIFYHGK